MVQVTVSEGILEGELVENVYGGSFYSFKGIPYAQPPVGDLRFKEPQPPKPWEGIRYAKQFGPKAYQNDTFIKTGKQGSEDCLYLNVYTPMINTAMLLPVMVWIHGGSFIYGSGDDEIYGPEFLVREEVILVTINYRLEVLGFLCLETEDIPGNAGMKDQVQALRWIKKNIGNFGGDPENVTIFGESAGGASVSYHLISPMSKGLFKRAICQSGTMFCNWAKAYKPRERALALARQLGCYSEDDKELYEFFMKQPVELLDTASVPILLSEKAVDNPVDAAMYFNVVGEKKFGDKEWFFDGDFSSYPERAEIMIGYNSDEGLFIPSDAVKPKLEMVRDFPESFISKPQSLNMTINQQWSLGKKIRKFYFNNQIDIINNLRGFANFSAMDMFLHGTVSYAKFCAKKNNVYLYKFSCKTERNVISNMLDLEEIIGDTTQVASHMDELFYLFKARIVPKKVNINSDTFKLMERVIKLWTNFAKHGNPTPDDNLGVQWKQYSLEDQDYLDIGNEFVPGNAPDAEELQFWESAFKEYGQLL